MQKTLILLVISIFVFQTAAFADVVNPNTLKNRPYDCIILPGAKLRDLVGSPLSQMILMAEHEGKLEPIPFQIDQKKGEEYLLTPSENARLSKDDELLFYARDAGGMVKAEDFPEGVENHLEIELRDSKAFQKGWVYLLLFAKGQTPQPIDYDEVRYDTENGTILTKGYRLHFSKKAPLSFDDLSPALGNGKYAPDFTDRLKIRFRAKVRGLGMHVSKNEEDFKTDLLGYKDGPLRVIRKIKSSVTFFGLFASPEAVSYQKYYGTFLEVPLVVNFPFDVSKAFSSANIAVITEMKRGAKAKYYNEKNPDGVVMDGIWSEKEAQLNLDAFSWAVIESLEKEAPGAWFNEIDIPPYMSGFKLYYADDATKLDPPEDDPGVYGAVGYQLSEFAKLKRGTHRLSSILYALPAYNPQTVQQIRQLKENPLKLWFGKVLGWQSR